MNREPMPQADGPDNGPPPLSPARTAVRLMDRPPSPKPPGGSRWRIWALILLCGFLYFYGLGSYPLFDEDEPRFAEAGREMIELGLYITPLFNYEWRLQKPILFYWFEIAAYKVFGVGEFAARFWSAAFMAALVLMTYFVCRSILGARAGFWAGIALATALHILVLGRAAVTDAMLCFFVAACVFSFFLGFRGRRGWYFACYAAAALAALTKGPVGVAIPGAAILPFLIHVRGFKRWLREGYVLPGLALFLLIALPWYLAEAKATNGVYVRSFLFGENVGRYTGTVGGHAGGWWFYLAVALVGFFPWGPFLLPAGGCVPVKRAAQMDGPAQFRLLCAWWAVTTVAAFSFSATKLPHYVAPAYPAMAALVGAYLGDPSAYPNRCGSLAKVSAGLIVALAGAFAVLFAVLPKLAYAKRDYLLAPGDELRLGWAPTALAAIFGATALAFLVTTVLRKRSIAFPVLAVGMILADVVVVTGFAPTVARLLSEPARDLAMRAAAFAGPEGKVIAYDWKSSNLVFYARRPIIRLDKGQTGQLADLMKTRARLAVLTKAENAVPSKFPGFETSSRRGKYILLTRR